MNEAMDKHQTSVLRQDYALLSGIGKFIVFRQALSFYVKQTATKLISDPSNDSHMVESLLELKAFCENTINSLAAADESATPHDRRVRSEIYGSVSLPEDSRLGLHTDCRDGFKAGVETRQAVPAELIAKHLDQVMRKGQASMSDQAFETLLENIVDLVTFTKDKDVFREFYTAQLAKRLLLGRSASTEEEISMVKKLQSQYGEEFTNGEAMMKDLVQSEDMNKKYQQLRVTQNKPPTPLTVNVLSQGQWPPYKPLSQGWESLTLDGEMQRDLDAFEAWYKHTFTGRVLSWRHQHASVTLTAKFPSGTKEIGVSLFQALILLQFNVQDEWSTEQLAQRTGIPDPELTRTLQSLYALKVTRVLTKRPPGKDVARDHVFSFNTHFQRDRVKFKINQLQQDLSAEESRQTSAKVFEDRNLTLDAQIVRIMKGKKKLKVQELVNQVIEAVEKLFQPEVKAIKSQIDSLIEREVRVAPRLFCIALFKLIIKKSPSTSNEMKMTETC